MFPEILMPRQQLCGSVVGIPFAGSPTIARAPGWRHVPQLDAMRAAAIGIVMLSHAGFERLVPGGFGVTVFFFLSGYLITSLLRLEASATGRVDLGAFYLRRTVRIIPPFVLAIVVGILLQFGGFLPMIATPGGVLVDLAFLTNYGHLLGVSASVPIPLWSLDVEEHFYIGFSTLFALILARRSPRAAAAFCAAACLVVLGLRFGHVLAGTELSLIYYWSHTRMDSILFGCVLALWNNPLLDDGAWRPRLGSLAIAAALLLSAFLIRDEVFRQTLRYTMQGVALFIVFSWLLHLDPKWERWFAIWPVKWMGLLSYTLYLIHLPLLQAAARLGIPMPWVWAYLLSAIYAFASYRLMEQPLARWRRRLEKRKLAAREMQVELP